MESASDSVGNERRVILIGKTGNGKSSTGNSMLGKEHFRAEKSTKSVTPSCEVRESIPRNSRPQYKVCDTPGLLDADVNLVDEVLEVQRSVKVCENPHAFLLVFNSAGRMTKEEIFTIDLLQIMFGKNVFEHCIIVFTRGGEFQTEQEFHKFWKASKMVSDLVEKCSNRVIRIENYGDSLGNNGLDKLLTMIEEVSKDGRDTYTYRWLDDHTEVLKDYRKDYDASNPVLEHLQAIDNALGRKLLYRYGKVGLYATVTVAALGGVGIGAGLAGTVAVRSLPVIGAVAGRVAGQTAFAVVSSIGKGVIQSMKLW